MTDTTNTSSDPSNTEVGEWFTKLLDAHISNRTDLSEALGDTYMSTDQECFMCLMVERGEGDALNNKYWASGLDQVDKMHNDSEKRALQQALVEVRATKANIFPLVASTRMSDGVTFLRYIGLMPVFETLKPAKITNYDIKTFLRIRKEDPALSLNIEDPRVMGENIYKWLDRIDELKYSKPVFVIGRPKYLPADYEERIKGYTVVNLQTESQEV